MSLVKYGRINVIDVADAINNVLNVPVFFLIYLQNMPGLSRIVPD